MSFSDWFQKAQTAAQAAATIHQAYRGAANQRQASEREAERDVSLIEQMMPADVQMRDIPLDALPLIPADDRTEMSASCSGSRPPVPQRPLSIHQSGTDLPPQTELSDAPRQLSNRLSLKRQSSSGSNMKVSPICDDSVPVGGASGVSVSEGQGFFHTVNRMVLAAKERMFGEDYWLPTDMLEVCIIPAHLVSSHRVLLPGQNELETCQRNDRRPLFTLLEGRYAKSLAETSIVYHVTFFNATNSTVLSVYRSVDSCQSSDIYQSCVQCRDLFVLIATSTTSDKEMKTHIRELVLKLCDHPLWEASHIAARTGMKPYFEKRYEKMPNALKRELHTQSQPEGNYPLHIAIEKNHCDLVRYLLSIGTEPDLADVYGNTTLHYAALASKEMIEILAAHDSCKQLINATNSEGATPVFFAIRAANARCIAALMGHGGTLNVRCKGRSALHEAMLLQSSEKCSMVIKAIMDAEPEMLQEKDPNTGNTALHVAAGKLPLGALLSLAAPLLDLDAPNKSGQTAVHVHSHKGDLGCVVTLAAYGADLDRQDRDGNTALHLAVSKLNTPLVRALLVLGANPNIRNKRNDGPRHNAAKLQQQKTRIEIVRALALCGAERCPVEKAAQCGYGCSATARAKAAEWSMGTASNLAAQENRKTQMAVTVDLVDDAVVRHRESSFSAPGSGASSAKNAATPDRTSPDKYSSFLMPGHSSSLEKAVIFPSIASRINEKAAIQSEQVPYIPDVNATAKLNMDVIRQYRQQLCLNHVRDILENAVAAREGSPDDHPLISVLCLDGGGIRGLILVQILLQLESLLGPGENLVDYFDWIAGTSTGSFVAAALAKGKSLRECQRIYLRFKDQVFEGWSRPYDTERLERFIGAELGFDAKLGDIEHPRLTITTVAATVVPCELHLLRNYWIDYISAEENAQLGFSEPKDQSLMRALRCSSAAPSFFTSVDGKFVDGGLISNNPTLDLLGEIELCNTVAELKLGNRAPKLQPGLVLSMGCGRIPDVPMDSLDLPGLMSGNPLTAATFVKNMGFLLVEQATQAEGAPVERSATFCATNKIPFYRFSPNMTKLISLDTKDDNDLVQMMWDTMEYMHIERPRLAECAQLLRALGKSEPRKHLFHFPQNGNGNEQGVSFQ